MATRCAPTCGRFFAIVSLPTSCSETASRGSAPATPARTGSTSCSPSATTCARRRPRCPRRPPRRCRHERRPPIRLLRLQPRIELLERRLHLLPRHHPRAARARSYHPLLRAACVRTPEASRHTQPRLGGGGDL